MTHLPTLTFVALLVVGTLPVGCARSQPGAEARRTPAASKATAAAAHLGAALGLSESDAGRVLARVGPSVITLGELAEELAQLSPYERARYRSPERLAEFLDARIRFELLVLEAQRRGFDKHPAMERARRQELAQALLEDRIDKRLSLDAIDEQSIANYYYAHKDDFTTGGDARTLDQVRPIIRHKIWRERREAAIEKLIAELRAKTDIQTGEPKRGKS